VHALARGYSRLIEAGAALAAVSIAFIALGVTADVAVRFFANTTIPWILETSEYLLFAVAFLGAPWVLHLGAHTAVDILVKAVPPGAQRVMGVAAHAVGLATSGGLFWYGGLAALQSRALGTMIYKTIVFPEWWVLACVPLCGALLAIEFAARMVRGVRGDALPLPQRQANL
jgi:TRAP-type C4-dicarboxylate transport system permease small subunit